MLSTHYTIILTSAQLSNGSTKFSAKFSAIHDNINRTGRNLKWAEEVREEDYLSYGTETLLPIPSGSRPDIESPTTRPHLSLNETLRIISVSQNPDISARSKVSGSWCTAHTYIRMQTFQLVHKYLEVNDILQNAACRQTETLEGI